MQYKKSDCCSVSGKVSTLISLQGGSLLQCKKRLLPCVWYGLNLIVTSGWKHIGVETLRDGSLLQYKKSDYCSVCFISTLGSEILYHLLSVDQLSYELLKNLHFCYYSAKLRINCFYLTGHWAAVTF